MMGRNQFTLSDMRAVQTGLATVQQHAKSEEFEIDWDDVAAVVDIGMHRCNYASFISELTPKERANIFFKPSFYTQVPVRPPAKLKAVITKYRQALGKSTESPRVRQKILSRLPREICRMRNSTGRINS